MLLPELHRFEFLTNLGTVVLGTQVSKTRIAHKVGCFSQPCRVGSVNFDTKVKYEVASARLQATVTSLFTRGSHFRPVEKNETLLSADMI